MKLIFDYYSKTLVASCVLLFTLTVSEHCSIWSSTIMTMSPLALCTRAAWRIVPLPGALHSVGLSSSHAVHFLPLSIMQTFSFCLCGPTFQQLFVTSRCYMNHDLQVLLLRMGAWRQFWLENCSAERTWSRWVILAPLRSWGQLISHGNQEGNRTSEMSLNGAVQALT